MLKKIYLQLFKNTKQVLQATYYKLINLYKTSGLKLNILVHSFPAFKNAKPPLQFIRYKLTYLYIAYAQKLQDLLYLFAVYLRYVTYLVSYMSSQTQAFIY